MLILSPTDLTLHPAELQYPTRLHVFSFLALPCLASWHCCSHCTFMLHKQSEILSHTHLNMSFFHTQNLKSVCEKAIHIYGCIYVFLYTEDTFIKE